MSKNSLLVIIPCLESNSPDTFMKTLNAIVTQENHSFDTKIVAWCMPNCSKDLTEFTEQSAVSRVLSVCDSYINLSLLDISLIDTCKHILLCSCGIIPRRNCFAFLKNKIKEYGENSILTARGFRLFPHEKISLPLKYMKEGVHWRFYDETKTDRAVHFFTSDFCLIGVSVLELLISHSNVPISQLGNLWYSFVMGYSLHRLIWKIQADSVIDCNKARLIDFVPSDNTEYFERFYSHLHKCDWPPSISHPFHDVKIMKIIKQNQETPKEIWKRGFGGVNMASEPATEVDFAAATAYGVKVIRVGAVCDAKDLAYLIDPEALTFEDDKKHFMSVLPRLRKALRKAGEHGLKVIITMTDLPGSKFCSLSKGSNFSFWKSSFARSRAAKFWGLMAESLADVSSIVMAYDIINEPYTPEDTEVQFFDDMPLSRGDVLYQFYLEALHEVRKHDKNVAVMIKSTWFACPRSFQILRPLPDNNVIYSFHMYAPPQLTLHRKHRKFNCQDASYPGPISRWATYPDEIIDITSEFLRQLLKDTVYSWQNQHHISSHHIVVAEFGICRETSGSEQYLNDLVAMFEQFGWSWLAFSFRDDEWDALDYELGPDMENMLHRTSSKLFMTLANHFH